MIKKREYRMLLFHGMGTGKTLTSICVAQGLLNNKIVDSVFVITPKSLVQNYNKELKKISKIPQIHVSTYINFLTNTPTK
jgi:SNF2 family DNA or RNA helicase